MQNDLDAIDLKILASLQDDASISAADLAERVGISQSPCWRRIQRLREDGYIKRQVAVLDRHKLGLNTHVFAHVKLSTHGRANLTKFSDAVREFPEVLECFVLMGTVDFLVRIVAEDIDAYERFFFNHLSQLPGVQEINSIIALSEIKSTTALPLPRARPQPAEKSPRKKKRSR